MSIVVEVIAEHLLSNRRLVVPAFGAFMVKESGERLFSDLLHTDDGVLTSLLRAKGLSEMEAAVTIDRFIFEVRHELEEYGYCRLGDVGTLRVEPESGVWRLYPPVYGEELPKHTPYIPEPIVDDEEEVLPQIEETEEPVAQPVKPAKPQARPKSKKKSRNGVDWVIVLAIVALVVALAVMAYGWYVSSLDYVDTTADDAAMSELRIQPNNDLVKE